MNKRTFKDKVFNELIGKVYSYICAAIVIILTVSIIIFLTTKGIKTFTEGFESVFNFLFTNNWNPDGQNVSLGASAFIIGSIYVSLGAVILSAPISIIIAVFVNIISKKLGANIIKPSLELLVGIPSVVYGWVGISVLVPFISKHFKGFGYSLLAGILVLVLMILPTIASLSIDAIKNVPNEYIEASYGLGSTRWQTITKVIIPSAKSGILTGVVLGTARAFGEALAVQMVIGNAKKIPDSLFSSMSTITSRITMDMANTAKGSAGNNGLWTLSLILLIISFLFILLIRKIEKGSEI